LEIQLVLAYVSFIHSDSTPAGEMDTTWNQEIPAISITMNLRALAF